MGAHLGKRGASNRYISAGFVSTEIAEKVTELSNGEKFSERVLVMSEKRLNHSYEKHQKDGIRLNKEEYASIARIIANPSTVLWDKDNKNLIYLNADKTIKVVVDAPNKDKLTPKEKVDAVINAYKIKRVSDVENAIKGGVYVVLE